MGKKKLVERRCSPYYVSNLFSHFEEHNENRKLAEIEAIGFGFLRRIPLWHVKQSIMLPLVRAYHVDSNTLRVDAGDIHVTTELIGKVLGIPSRGDGITELNKENASHGALKRQFQKKITTQLHDFVYGYQMDTEEQRMDFRRHFILVVLKMFLCPTSQQTISPWHIPPILDVSNPRRFHWPHSILKWLQDAIQKFQNAKRETCGRCMFILLILYFQQLKYAPLDECQTPEPWVAEWTASELDNKASQVISQVDHLVSTLFHNEHTGLHRVQSQKSCYLFDHYSMLARRAAQTNGPRWTQNKGDLPGAGPYFCNHMKMRRSLLIYRLHHRNVSLALGGSCTFTEANPSKETKQQVHQRLSRKAKGTPLIVPDSDDEENEPLVRRKSRLFYEKVSALEDFQAETKENVNNERGIEDHHGPSESPPRTPSSALVQLPNEFDVSIMQCPEFKEMLANVEQGRNIRPVVMEPLQTVMPKTPRYHTPSPGKPSFSLGLTQWEKTPIPSPARSIHPRLRNFKIGEKKEKQILAWIRNSYLEKEEHLAAFEGRKHLVLCRKDLWTLKTRAWISSMETITRGHNLKSFKDGANPMYVGFRPSFGEDNRFFDKVQAATRTWGRLIEDMARVAIPAYVRTTNGPSHSYVAVQKQPNNYDCGIFVIKFMETWTDGCKFDEWDEDMLRESRSELMLDIVCGPHNTLVDKVLTILEDKANPEVKSPFMAPSTRTLTRRAEGLPKCGKG
ncbi:hypothetical protein Ahy_A01g002121 [Arachis hypogaea]|uniref:Ubiquitin-like protease family profile domain-containing protein n=1 Tax=Arachis hypogaea TaxID=3818 RepID=A0A445EQ48_ARAHY|nr:hypothetical protein Ahy_A01g002121 [Arachis hypogaea]